MSPRQPSHRPRRAWAVLLAASCGGSPPARPAADDAKVAAPTDEASKPAPVPGCDASRADDINAHLVEQCQLAAEFAPPGMPVVHLDPRPRPDGLLLVRVLEGGLLLVDNRPADENELVDTIRERAAATKEMALAHGRPPMDVRFALEAEAAATSASVKAMLVGLHAAQVDRGMVMLASDATVSLPEPRDKTLADTLVSELGDLDPAQRATTLARKIEPVVKPCASLVEVYGAVASVAPEQKCELLARGTAEALVECGCPASENELLTLMWVMMVGNGDPHRAIPVPVHLDPDTAAPMAVGDATWGETASKLVAGADLGTESTVWLE